MPEPITGKDGTVTKGGGVVAHVRKWSLEITSDNKPYVTNSTAGVTKRAKGNKDWSGSLTIYLDDGDPTAPGITEGETYALELKTSAGHKYSGDAIIDSISPEVDIEGAELVGAEVAFSGNGALARS